jgi:HSP20 family protein
MTLVKFSPEKGKGSLISGFNDVFDSIFTDTFFTERPMTKVPAVNISETEDHFHVELAAPGLQKEDFKLNLDRNMLNISVEQRQTGETKEKNYNKREYSYSSFVRSFSLPDSADQQRIDASYVNGILKIDIAKKEEAKSVVKQIEIK